MIYLDNSATTKPFDEAIDSFVKVSKQYFGNPSSIHGLGGQAEKLVTQSRVNVAQLLNVQPQEIIFTAGGTEGNNLAIKGASFANKSRGTHIITTGVEHPSVSEACKQLVELGFEITYLPVNQSGFISVEDVKNALREDTILVSIIHVNNEIGAIQPIEEIGRLVKNYPKVLFHVDHVQGIGKVPIDIHQVGIDLCTISGHKFNGLKGTGVLYVRNGVNLSPLLAGGNQEMGIRSGTENVAGIVSLAKALRLTLDNSKEKIQHIQTVKDALLHGLSDIPDVTINTPIIHSAPHIVNFSINGLKSEVFVHLLEEEEIIVSTTSACSSKSHMPSKTLLAMKMKDDIANSAIRISLSHLNTTEEIPKIITAINKSLNKLKKVMR